MPKNNKKLTNSIINIPMPSSINMNWSFGSILGMSLFIQMLSGFLISIHYSPSIQEAFKSVIEISRNINNGWLVRSMHINSASMFFAFIFLHISKNLLMKSYKIKMAWNMGVLIMLILMATAFMGYVLPWGQMSFWAATVITNLMSAIPIWGKFLVNWLWGGFSVDAPTLNRFFSLHFALPFIISAMAMAHILLLHTTGSKNPISIPMNKDKISFHPFFTSKDMIGLSMSTFILMSIMLIYPFISSDPENFMPANPLVTPNHIQPEWYFLFAYAILRSIPSKLGGVIALAMSILILAVKTIQKSSKNSFKFSKMNMLLFSILAHTFFMLTWIATKQIEHPFEIAGQVYTMMYFSIMLFL